MTTNDKMTDSEIKEAAAAMAAARTLEDLQREMDAAWAMTVEQLHAHYVTEDNYRITYTAFYLKKFGN